MGKDIEVYIDKLKKVLKSNAMELREVDTWLKAAIARCILCKYRVYIYGAGKDVDIFTRFLLNEGIDVFGIVDKDIRMQGQHIEGIGVVSPNVFVRREKNKDSNTLYVFIYPLFACGSIDEKETIELLKEVGVTDYSFVGNSRYTVAGYLPEYAVFQECRRSYYRSHEEKLIETLKLLYDNESREVFIEYIRAYSECSYYRYEPLPVKWKYFKGKDGKQLYKNVDEEIWINCGADEGGTIAHFLIDGMHAKKIYAIECNAENLKRLDYYEKCYYSKGKRVVYPIDIYIDEFSKDTIEKRFETDERITLLNADIEGNELSMLRGMEKILKRDKPVIAICVYHKKEDLIEIPKYIESISNEYIFMLRKYASWIRGDSMRVFELVLYAIPRDRMMV